MNVKNVELSKAEQALKKIGSAIEALYKANIKKYEKEIKKLTEELKKSQQELDYWKADLEKAKNKLIEIKKTYLSRMSEDDLENKQALEASINEGQDVSQINNYYNLLVFRNEVESNIKALEISIKNIKAKKDNEIEKTRLAKEKFTKKYTTFVNTLFKKFRVKIQKIKVTLAGEKIELKSDSEGLFTLSLEDLKKLNEISNLIQEKSVIESDNKSNKTLFKNNEKNVEELEKKLGTQETSIDKNSINKQVEEQMVIATQAKKTKAVIDKIMFAIKLFNIKSDNPIIIYIENQQNIQTLKHSFAIKEVERLQNILINSINSIEEKKKEIESAKAALKSLSERCSKEESSINELTNTILEKLTSLLNEPNLTTEQAIERINNLINFTPFMVKNLSKKPIKQ